MLFNVMHIVIQCLISLCMQCFDVGLLSWSVGVGILGGSKSGVGDGSWWCHGGFVFSMAGISFWSAGYEALWGCFGFSGTDLSDILCSLSLLAVLRIYVFVPFFVSFTLNFGALACRSLSQGVGRVRLGWVFGL